MLHIFRYVSLDQFSHYPINLPIHWLSFVSLNHFIGKWSNLSLSKVFQPCVNRRTLSKDSRNYSDKYEQNFIRDIEKTAQIFLKLKKSGSCLKNSYSISVAQNSKDDYFIFSDLGSNRIKRNSHRVVISRYSDVSNLFFIQTLTLLYLYQNQIGENGAQNFVETLKTNKVRISSFPIHSIIIFIFLPSSRHCKHSTFRRVSPLTCKLVWNNKTIDFSFLTNFCLFGWNEIKCHWLIYSIVFAYTTSQGIL